MIIEGLLNLILGLLKVIFGILPNLPQFPFWDTMLDFFNETLSAGLGLFCFFIRPSTVLTALPIFIAIFLFEHVYGAITWVVKKIPFIDIE